MKEMNDAQRKAFDIWIHSATLSNNFTTITLPELAKHDDVSASKSTLGRWKIKFDWDKQLELKVTSTSIQEPKTKELISKTSIGDSTAKSMDDFDKNSEAKDYTYILLIHDLKELIEKIQKGGATSEKDKRFYLKALEILAGREDKLLDRIANLQLVSNLLSPEEALAALRNLDVELEDDISDADIMIEE